MFWLILTPLLRSEDFGLLIERSDIHLDFRRILRRIIFLVEAEVRLLNQYKTFL